jgi:hypothetical protein
MSRRESIAPDAMAAREAATRSLTRPPYSLDRNLKGLQDTDAGEPVLVFSPRGVPEFWLVPFLRGSLACGFARVTVHSLDVTHLGLFGGRADDQASWLPASFFRGPPKSTLGEIASRYPRARLSKPIMSYDRSPARWGWRITLDGEGHAAIIFVGPSGWYVQSTAADSRADGTYEG